MGDTMSLVSLLTTSLELEAGAAADAIDGGVPDDGLVSETFLRFGSMVEEGAGGATFSLVLASSDEVDVEVASHNELKPENNSNINCVFGWLHN